MDTQTTLCWILKICSLNGTALFRQQLWRCSRMKRPPPPALALLAWLGVTAPKTLHPSHLSSATHMRLCSWRERFLSSFWLTHGPGTQKATLTFQKTLAGNCVKWGFRLNNHPFILAKQKCIPLACAQQTNGRPTAATNSEFSSVQRALVWE